MSDHQDAFHAKVEAERATRRRFFIKGEGDMFFSAACKEIAGEGAAVAVLIHVLFRQSFPPRAKERKKLERAGLWPPPPQEFSFPYREARHHGLTEKALAAGLAALHRVGFIDRIHPGSGKKRGDFARYIISERWRAWSRPDFKELPWEKATSVGRHDKTVVDDDGNVIHKGTGKFIPSRPSKSGARRSVVAAKSAATEDQLTAKSAATTSPVAAKSAVNTPPPGVFVAAKSAVFLSSPSSDVDPDGGLGGKGGATPIRPDVANTSRPITDDPKAIADLAAALSSIGHLPAEASKKKRGRPRRNLAQNTSPISQPGYDPDLGPWAKDESRTASIGRGGTIH